MCAGGESENSQKPKTENRRRARLEIAILPGSALVAAGRTKSDQKKKKKKKYTRLGDEEKEVLQEAQLVLGMSCI